jgi:hypothetical protein
MGDATNQVRFEANEVRDPGNRTPRRATPLQIASGTR